MQNSIVQHVAHFSTRRMADLTESSQVLGYDYALAQLKPPAANCNLLLEQSSSQHKSYVD